MLISGSAPGLLNRNPRSERICFCKCFTGNTVDQPTWEIPFYKTQPSLSVFPPGPLFLWLVPVWTDILRGAHRVETSLETIPSCTVSTQNFRHISCTAGPAHLPTGSHPLSFPSSFPNSKLIVGLEQTLIKLESRDKFQTRSVARKVRRARTEGDSLAWLLTLLRRSAAEAQFNFSNHLFDMSEKA